MIFETVLIAWIHAAALTYGVDPSFAEAVARVESGVSGGPALRVGRLGKSRYYGPFGIERSFLRRWDIANPYVNVEIGVKALRGRDKRAVLRRYNPKLTPAYEAAVMGTYRRLKRERHGRESNG